MVLRAMHRYVVFLREKDRRGRYLGVSKCDVLIG